MAMAGFIALQCFQCSTMQVKQRKKSTNKWTCVVCNEKQSMRHVFAQGNMARDVRKFVQTFNMSRQFADQNHKTLAPTLCEENEVAVLSDQKKKKKRTDWSEYVEYEVEIKDEIEDVNEPKIVTELPKAMFRKPTLSTSAGRMGSYNKGNGFKPNFGKRKSVDTDTTQDTESSKYQHTRVGKAPKWSDTTSEEKNPTVHNWASKTKTYPAQQTENIMKLKAVPSQFQSTSAKVLSKWNNYTVQDKNECEGPTVFNQSGKAKQVSKWDEYLTTEEDEDRICFKGLRDISNLSARQQLDDDGLFDVICGERVEEDVHPDFQ